MTNGIIWYLIFLPLQVAIIVSSVSFLQNQRSYRRELKRQAEEEDKVRLRQQIAVLEAEVNVPLDVLIRTAERKAEREYRLACVDRVREDFVYGLNQYSEHDLEHLVKVRFATRPGGEKV